VHILTPPIATRRRQRIDGRGRGKFARVKKIIISNS